MGSFFFYFFFNAPSLFSRKMLENKDISGVFMGGGGSKENTEKNG